MTNPWAAFADKEYRDHARIRQLMPEINHRRELCPTIAADFAQRFVFSPAVLGEIARLGVTVL
ncbi:hypothetical protein [Pseudolabrys taiwanensis]|uniref:hypothetical protein n=1 Tax=Pseudolabrys taiwanensis TaxID=331696 RepID=UPI0013B402B1|nr:hypothetical protein [Pseudolabrys taiwanensis]